MLTSGGCFTLLFMQIINEMVASVLFLKTPNRGDVFERPMKPRVSLHLLVLSLLSRNCLKSFSHPFSVIQILPPFLVVQKKLSCKTLGSPARVMSDILFLLAASTRQKCQMVFFRFTGSTG
jgi:hypothetical protein